MNEEEFFRKYMNPDDGIYRMARLMGRDGWRERYLLVIILNVFVMQREINHLMPMH